MGAPSLTAPGDDAQIAEYLRIAYSDQGDRSRVDALSAYARQAEQYPQLPADRQARLVEVYQASRRAAEDLAARRLRGGAVAKARREVRRGDEALTHLVTSNFRLVLVIVNDALRPRMNSALRPRMLELRTELVQEGNLALTIAAQEWDPERIPHWPTWAARRIRDRVREALARMTETVRVPASVSRMSRMAKPMISDLTVQLGRTPTTDELRSALRARCVEWAESKLSPEQRELPADERARIVEYKLSKQGMLKALADLDEVLAWSPHAASLDAPVGDDGGSTFGEMLDGAPTEGGGLFAGIELDELRRDLSAALATLSERERDIILHRYGFVDGEVWTYQRISERWDVSAERIRQLESAVLERLRSPHVQYAALSAHLPSQIVDDDEPASAGNARIWFSRR